MDKIVVCIDPGHGGASDFGASSGSYIEKNMNLSWARELKELLEVQNIEVCMTRNSDIDVPLIGRTRYANSIKANIFVSLHHNAFNSKAKGYEIYHYTGSKNGARLASCISKYFDGFNNKRYVGPGMYAGAEPDYNYHVIRETNMPAVLIEPLFLDNMDDVAKFNPKLQAELVAKGVCDYFNIKYKEVAKPDIKKEEIQKYIKQLDTIKAFLEDLLK